MRTFIKFVLCLAAVVAVGITSNKADAQAAAAAPAAPAVVATVQAPAITPPDLCVLTPIPAPQRGFCAAKKLSDELAKKEAACTAANGKWDAAKRPQCDFSEQEKKNCEAGLVDGNNDEISGSKGVWDARNKSCVFDGTREDMGFCLPFSARPGETPRESFDVFKCWVYNAARRGPAGGGVSAATVDKKIVAALEPVKISLTETKAAVVRLETKQKASEEVDASQNEALGTFKSELYGYDKDVAKPDGSTDTEHVPGLEELVRGRDTDDGSGKTVHQDGLVDATKAHRDSIINAWGKLERLQNQLNARGLLFSVGGGGFLASGGELNAKVGDKSHLVRGSYLRGAGLSLGLDFISGSSTTGGFMIISTATTDGAGTSGAVTTFEGSALTAGVQHLRALDDNWALGGFAAFQTSRVGSLLLSPRASGMGVVAGLVGRANLALSERFRVILDPKVGLGYEWTAASVEVEGKSKPASTNNVMLFGSLELRLGYRPQ